MTLFVGATKSLGRHIKHKHEFRGMRTIQVGSKRKKTNSTSEALASAIICKSSMHASYEILYMKACPKTCKK